MVRARGQVFGCFPDSSRVGVMFWRRNGRTWTSGKLSFLLSVDVTAYIASEMRPFIRGPVYASLAGMRNLRVMPMIRLHICMSCSVHHIICSASNHVSCSWK